MSVELPPPDTSPNPSRAEPPPGRAPIDSDTLFGGAREVQIVHGGAVYLLKQTALGKLILTK